MSDRKPAVIYVRVASVGKESLGDASAAQEEICRKAAESGGYEVRKVFVDHASGLSADRPGFRAMLESLEAHRGEAPAVFIEHIPRLARSVELIYKLGNEISARGGTVRCADTDLARLKGRGSVERERD